MQASKQHQQIASQIYKFIQDNDNFLISSHVNADGDAVASALCVKLLLDYLGKKSVLIFQDAQIDQRFNYLAQFDQILSFQDKITIERYKSSNKIENAIILDVPGEGRLGDVAQLLPSKERIIKIDHHPVEDIIGVIDWVDENASSTTVMVHEVVEVSGMKIDIDLAETIFTGIIYDTGRFSFSNTTSRDLYVCSRMVEIGVKPSEITNKIFFENSFSALKTIGKGLYSLEKYLDGAVNVIYLGYDDMQNSDQSEIEELANYSVAIRGGKVGLFVREVKPGFHKVSFRSHSNVDVNKVAKAFDGGGHSRASGCRLDGSKEEILPKIIAEIGKQL